MKGGREGGQEEGTGGRGEKRWKEERIILRGDFRYPDLKVIPPDIAEFLPSSDFNDFNVLSIV